MSTQIRTQRRPVRLRVRTKRSRSAVGAVIMIIAAACGTDSPTGPNGETASLQALSPIVLTGTVGAAVEPAPTVIAKDPAGKPLAGVRVEFLVQSGGGSVSAPSAITNSTGVASVPWVLGTSIDPRLKNQLVAQAPGLGQVRFTATAKPSAPAQMRKERSPGDTLVGGFVVETSTYVADAYGNRIDGVPVTFTITRGGGHLDQGLGAVTTARATTNVAGVAQIDWVLGPPGENTVTASVEDLDDVSFSVTALDPGNFTWYDLEVSDGSLQAGIDRSYIGLDSNGRFAWQTIWQGGFSISEFGHYEITASRITLFSGYGRYALGVIESDRLVLEWSDLDDSGLWIYGKRKIAP
jgi:hypothetical protein